MHESNTHQQLERTESKPRGAAWEEAFLAQLTDELADAVAAYAKKRAKWMQAKAKRKDDLLWKELYQDAITDTWTGDLAWDPEQATLELHLRRAIRSRSSNAMKHLAKFPRVAANGAPTLGLEAEMSDAMAADRASDRGVDLRPHVDAVIGKLHELATGDDEVARILDCFAEGVLDRRDIMRATKLNATTYHNARRRLLWLVQRLPQDLRDEAIQAMA